LNVTFSSHTVITATTPPGSGTGWFLWVEPGLNPVSKVAPTLVRVGYLPPIIDSISPTTVKKGDLLTIYGSNFGGGSVLPRVYLNGKECTVGGSPTNKKITAYVPGGVGKNLDLVVQVGFVAGISNGRYSDVTSKTKVSYMPPEVMYLTPSNGPTLPLPNAVLTITGKYLGDDAIKEIKPCLPPKTGLCDNLGINSVTNVLSQYKIEFKGSPTVVIPPANITFINSTHLRFYSPENQGIVKVEVTIGNPDLLQDQVASGALVFSYDVPVLKSVSLIAPASEYSTDGGYDIELVGTNFGKSFVDGVMVVNTLSVSYGRRIKSYLCVIKKQDHKSVICTVPAGVGGDMEILLKTSQKDKDQEMVLRSGIYFSYAKPSIDCQGCGFSQNPVDASGTSVEICGNNFGPLKPDDEEGAVSVSFPDGSANPAACSETRWAPADSIVCQNNLPYIKW
jgi:hypothetical protein